ncbi:MAG: response regulator [Elusimicrobia bacterium]|nr:response regulator [Elusimicrobiota bacterium]
MKKILIVDDSRLTRTIIRNSLSAAGYVVVGEARNGREAVDMYRELKPDLVTMDLTMPDSYGMESTKDILNQNPDAKILVVTALNQKLLQQDAKRIGARAMIAKPFQPIELIKVVTDLLGPPALEEPIKLTPDQIEDMIELGNIGVGNAASTLSDLIQRRCNIDIPNVTYLDVQGIKTVLDTENSYVVALHIKIMGDVPALMFVVMRRAYADTLVKYLAVTTPEACDKDLSMAAMLILKQLGEILTRAFSESISHFLSTRARYAMPEIYVDAWSSALDDILGRMDASSHKEYLVLRSSFFDPEKTFKGHFIYILDNKSQQIVLSRIRLLLMNEGL